MVVIPDETSAGEGVVTDQTRRVDSGDGVSDAVRSTVSLPIAGGPTLSSQPLLVLAGVPAATRQSMMCSILSGPRLPARSARQCMHWNLRREVTPDWGSVRFSLDATANLGTFAGLLASVRGVGRLGCLLGTTTCSS